MRGPVTARRGVSRFDLGDNRRIAARARLNSVFDTQVNEAVRKDGLGGTVRVEKDYRRCAILVSFLVSFFAKEAISSRLSVKRLLSTPNVSAWVLPASSTNS